MPPSNTPPSRLALGGLVALLLAAGLAGCVGGDDGDADAADLSFAGYEEAREAPGTVLDPVEGSLEAEVKLLAPPSPDVDSPGRQPVILLVHDPAAGEPVTDATVALEARMPAMGHGTGPEEAPTHAGDGIYEGRTTWSMPGEWVLHMDVELPDGSSASYAPEVTVGAHDEGPQREPLDPYGSFDEVMSAPGTVYEGELVAPAVDNATFTDEVSDAAYERREPVAFEDRPLRSVTVEAELDPGTDLDTLNVTLVDPSGAPAASVELTASEPAAEAGVEDPSTGEWQVNVTGNGLGASYEVVVEGVYVPPHVDVKTLDPADPTRALTGERPFLFAVFEAHGPSPVSDAEVGFTSRMPDMGHGAPEEEDPTYEGAGQHQARSGFNMEGEWVVTIDVALPTGEEYRYEVDAQVYEPGNAPSGGGGGGDGSDHDH